MVPSETDQYWSAQRLVAATNVTHGGRIVTEVTVGVTPARKSLQTMHFCSAKMRLLEVDRRGDGRCIPVNDPDYEVVLPGGLHFVPSAGLMRLQMIVVPNGRLAFHARKHGALFVPFPADLLQDRPWAFDSCGQRLLEAKGYDTLDEMFTLEGQVLLA